LSFEKIKKMSAKQIVSQRNHKLFHKLFHKEKRGHPSAAAQARRISGSADQRLLGASEWRNGPTKPGKYPPMWVDPVGRADLAGSGAKNRSSPLSRP
jgi:hypothetical protein